MTRNSFRLVVLGAVVVAVGLFQSPLWAQEPEKPVAQPQETVTAGSTESFPAMSSEQPSIDGVGGIKFRIFGDKNGSKIYYRSPLKIPIKRQ